MGCPGEAWLLDLPATVVVFWEHLILVVLTVHLPVRFAKNMLRLNGRDLIAIPCQGAASTLLVESEPVGTR